MIARIEPVASVCVYCGSRNGTKPVYRDAATAFGAGLAARRLRLVYGAGRVGLMGALGASCRDNGGDTFGVIPSHLVPREGQLDALDQIVITETMHERKKVMAMNSDAFVTLPGGGGSLDEFFEVMTWAQLGLHQKPIYLLNIDGYWDKLCALLQQLVSEGFASESSLKRVGVYDAVDPLLDDLSARLS